MVVAMPDDFFIYATKNKLWIVINDQIWEFKDYFPIKVNVSVNNDVI